MQVDKLHCTLECTVCDKPISMVFDCFHQLQVSELQFKVFKLFGGSVVCDGGVDCRDDDIEVNCFPLQYFDSLGVRELGQCLCTEQIMLCDFDVNHLVMDEFSGEFLTNGEGINL